MEDRLGVVIDRLAQLYRDKDTLASYERYYASLRNWILDNRDLLEPEFSQQYGLLRTVLELDYVTFLVDEPDFVLELEPQRMLSTGFGSVETVLQELWVTMWEMVTVVSDSECVNCTGNDVRYVIFEILPCGPRELDRECSMCGFAERVAGPELDPAVASMRPALQSEIDSMRPA